MAQSLEQLIAYQRVIADARAAAKIEPDPKLSRWFAEQADDLERVARRAERLK